MRRLLALSAAVGSLAIAGCGATPSLEGGGQVDGDTLVIASLLPLTGPQARAAADAAEGQRLALDEARGRVGRFAIRLMVVDEGSADPALVPAAAAAAAREALADPRVIAVVGSLDSEAARVSVPLLNAAGIAQVSPSAGYAGLTGAGALPGEPARYYPSGRRSFVRVGGDDVAMASAMARVAATGGARIVAVESEPGVAAGALAAALRDAARRRGLGLTADPARADAVLYAGDDPETPAGIAGGTARPWVVAGEDALRAGAARRARGAAAARVVLVHRITAAAGASFRARVERRPGPFAATGYAAMRRVLAAIAAAGAEGNDREAVVRALLRARAPRSGFATVTPARGR